MKLAQFARAGRKIRHVHVMRLEPGAIKYCGHFHLTIDTLLAEHGNLGTGTARNVRRRNIVARIESHLHNQRRGIARTLCGKFLTCAVRIIT